MIWAFGTPGAVVVQLKIPQEMFSPILVKYSLPMLPWAVAAGIAIRVTHFIDPEGEMGPAWGWPSPRN